MDKIIEEKEYLKLGKHTIDVSNIPVGRKKIVRELWNDTIKEYQEELKKTEDIEAITVIYNKRITDIYERQGLYLIRQPFIVLSRRYGFFKTILEIIKRRLLTVKFLNRLDEKDYDAFQEWVHFTITGSKKKDLEIQESLMLAQNKMMEVSEKMNISPDQLTALLLTLLDQMDGSTSISALSPNP